MNLDEFKRVTSEVSSEMFLALIILIQNSLPCTENFQRYQKNFERYMTPGDQDKSGGEGAGSDGESKTKTIASPKHMGNLSPVEGLAKIHGINFQPPSQRGLLKCAVNKKEEEEVKDIDAFTTPK